MPSWYLAPDYLFALFALAGVALRDKWIVATASLLCADSGFTWFASAHVPADAAWAYKAIADLSVALSLAWFGDLRSLAIAALMGMDVTGYLAIGASHAFGDDYTQTYVNYEAWWGMLWLSFAICGVLAIGSFENHGGKSIRRRAARCFRGDRRAVLESANPYRSPTI